MLTVNRASAPSAKAVPEATVLPSASGLGAMETDRASSALSVRVTNSGAPTRPRLAVR